MNDDGFVAKMCPGPEDPGKTIVIALRGAIRVERAAEVRDIFARALLGGEHVVLDLSGCSALDLSFLQLLCSAHKTALRSNKHLKVGTILPECFMKTVDEAGYARREECEVQIDNCLWARR